MKNPLKELEEEVVRLRLELKLLNERYKCCKESKCLDENICRQIKFDINLYREVFKNNLSVMLLIDAKTGKIVDANQAALDFYGYSIDEITNNSIYNINTLSIDEIKSQMDKAIASRANKFYFKHRLSNGEIRDVEVTSGPITLENRKYLYSIIFDITDQKKNNTLLAESEKKFKQLFNSVNDALFVFKVGEDGIPSKFLEVNEEACRKLGYTYSEMLEISPLEIEKHEKKSVIEICNLMAHMNFTNYQTIHVNKYNREIPVEINTYSFELFEERAILVVARDISKRKEMERKLKNSFKRQAIIMEFLPSAVFIVTKGKIAYVNEYGIKLLGYSSYKDIKGREYLSIVHRDFKEAVIERHESINTKEKIATLLEEKYINVSGKTIDVEVTGVKIPYENSSAILIVARNITDIKKIESELEEKTHLEKLRTEFFANISHELRTPLNVILGSLQLQELYLNANPFSENINKYRRSHEKMKRSCFRLLRLINNLIDITRIDSGFYNIKLYNYDIIFLLKTIVMSVEDYVRNKKLNISFSSNIEELIIACDPEKIERIILNLLSNAIKFTESGGSISISITNYDEEVSISVKDTGIGIPKEKIGIIFERFVQIDKSMTRKHEGSGIGLSLVKSLIEMHQGSIKVISSEEEGSEFIISLPIRNVYNTEAEAYRELYDIGFNVERIYVEFSDIY